MLKKVFMSLVLLNATQAFSAPEVLKFNGYFGGNLFFEEVLLKRLGVEETFEVINRNDINAVVFSKVSLSEISIICTKTNLIDQPEYGTDFNCQVTLPDGKNTIFGTIDDNHTEANFLTIYMDKFFVNTVVDQGVEASFYSFKGSLNCRLGFGPDSFVCEGISK